MPPTAKVHIARPRVAVQKAGLRKSPEKLVRVVVGLSVSAEPRLGSRTKSQKQKAIRTPGAAAT